jgi:hypothetical protein
MGRTARRIDRSSTRLKGRNRRNRRISNKEPRIQKWKQRFHALIPSTFCGSLFDILRFDILLAIDHPASMEPEV